MQDLVATVLRENFRFDNATGDVVILSGCHAKGSVTLKGPADEMGPDVNGTYRFYGKWSPYHNKRTGKEERQFHFRSFVPEEPKGRQAVIAYLERCPSITRGIAEQLWDAFEEEAIVRLAEGDPLLLGINRLTDKRIEVAVEWLEEQAAIRDSVVEVAGLLDGRGFPKAIVRDCVKAFGARAAWIIRRNPYVLMRFRGCGFRRADRLYLDLGHNPRAVKRLLYAAEHTISQWSGDTWFALSAVDRELRGVIGGADIDVRKVRELGRRSRRLSFLYTDGPDGPPAMDGSYPWVTTTNRASDERRIARRVKELVIPF